MLKKLVGAALYAFVFLITACGEKTNGSGEMMLSPAKTEFLNTDVTGVNYGHDFSLVDHMGKHRTLIDFRGKAVFVFFGYTHCPDVCPTTMAEMAEVMKRLGASADKLQVLFITLDPERDTQEVLAQYVPAFDPRFIGLRGTQKEIDEVANEFKVFHQKVLGKTNDSYTVDHTSGAYVFDPQGRIRLFVRSDQGVEPITHDLEILLGGT